MTSTCASLVTMKTLFMLSVLMAFAVYANCKLPEEDDIDIITNEIMKEIKKNEVARENDMEEQDETVDDTR